MAATSASLIARSVHRTANGEILMSPDESPWLLVAIGAAVVLIALLRVVPRKGPLGVALAGLGLLVAIGGFVLDATLLSPRERLEQRLTETVAAFAADDAEAFVAAINPDRSALVTLAGLGVAMVDIAPDYRLTDIRTDPDDDTATQRFRLNGEYTYGQTKVGHRPTLWELRWVQVDGEWVIDEVHELDPIRGERQDRFNELR